VAEDSALAIAALRGAEAADWENQPTVAADLVAAASAQSANLPPKYAAYLKGFQSYQLGRADSAAAQFQRAIALDSTWSGAWTALGEVYYHLVPDTLAADSTASAAFLKARQFDPDFTPNLYHLAELALRRGDVGQAESYLRALRRSNASEQFGFVLDLAVSCVQGRTTGETWRQAATTYPARALSAAQSLSVGLAHARCAEEGFRAFLATPNAGTAAQWDALLGLHNLLVATGRSKEAIQLLDSAVAGMPAANFLFIVDTWLGVGADGQAERAVASIGRDFDAMRSSAAWAVSLFAAARRDSSLLLETATSLDRRAAETHTPIDSMLARSAFARLALLRGDTVGALSAFAGIRSESTRETLSWGVWEPFALERIQLARLLTARGEYEEAAHVAGTLDHPQAVMNLLFVPEALDIRIGAAEARGRVDEVRSLRRRRAAL